MSLSLPLSHLDRVDGEHDAVLCHPRRRPGHHRDGQRRRLGQALVVVGVTHDETEAVGCRQGFVVDVVLPEAALARLLRLRPFFGMAQRT